MTNRREIVAGRYPFVDAVATYASPRRQSRSYMGQGRPRPISLCDPLSHDPDVLVSNGSKMPDKLQESYIQVLCKEREVDTGLELEIRKLYDHKKEFNNFPVRNASRVIDRLRACPKKVRIAW